MARLDLLKRVRDPDDRRNVFVQRTVKGSVFLRDLGDRIGAAWEVATPYDNVFRPPAGAGEA